MRTLTWPDPARNALDNHTHRYMNTHTYTFNLLLTFPQPLQRGRRCDMARLRHQNMNDALPQRGGLLDVFRC